MQGFPVGAWIPFFDTCSFDGEVLKEKLSWSNKDRRLELEIIGKAHVFFNDQIKWTLPDLRRDNRQDVAALVDQIAGAIEDVQDARTLCSRQPVEGGRRNGDGVNGPPRVLSQIFGQMPLVRSGPSSAASLGHWDFPLSPSDRNIQTS